MTYLLLKLIWSMYQKIKIWRRLRWIIADASLCYTVNRIYGGETNSQQRVSSEASVSIKPIKPLVVNGNVFYLWYSSSDVQNDPIVSASVSWTFRRFSIFAECRNLLDVHELRKEYIHPYRIIKHTSSLRGREYLFGVRMSLWFFFHCLSGEILSCYY